MVSLLSDIVKSPSMFSLSTSNWQRGQEKITVNVEEEEKHTEEK
jgi:hypothetical protein